MPAGLIAVPTINIPRRSARREAVEASLKCPARSRDMCCRSGGPVCGRPLAELLGRATCAGAKAPEARAAGVRSVLHERVARGG